MRGEGATARAAAMRPHSSAVQASVLNRIAACTLQSWADDSAGSAARAGATRKKRAAQARSRMRIKTSPRWFVV